MTLSLSLSYLVVVGFSISLSGGGGFVTDMGVGRRGFWRRWVVGFDNSRSAWVLMRLTWVLTTMEVSGWWRLVGGEISGSSFDFLWILGFDFVMNFEFWFFYWFWLDGKTRLWFCSKRVTPVLDWCFAGIVAGLRSRWWMSGGGVVERMVAMQWEWQRDRN